MQENQWHGEERRQSVIDYVQLAQAVAQHMPQDRNGLTDEERQWVKLAIQREAQSIKLRQAIIEKTIGSLIWAAFIGLGLIIVDWVKSHGFK